MHFKDLFVPLVCLAAGLSRASPLSSRSCPAEGGYQNAVYFTNWAVYGRNYHPHDLPASDITHVLYAFLNLRPNGEVYSGDSYSDLEKRYPTDSWNDSGNNAYGCVKQLFSLKKANRHLKTLLSIGGWTWSTNFPAVAATAEGRSTFAKSSVAYMKDWGFDGIDIDWEYPADKTEAANFVLLLQAVRDELDAYAKKNAPGYHFLLTIACSAGPKHYGLLDLGAISKVIDIFYLMAYDYAGSWDTKSGHQANLHASKDNPSSTPFSTDSALKAYLDAGVPASKIVLGMPIYGRAFASTDGLGKDFSGVGDGSWEKGIWDYKSLPRNGAKVLFDKEAMASYTYDESSRELVSFDTPAVVEDKVAYLLEKGLAGSMFWEASADKTGEGSLLATSRGALASGGCAVGEGSSNNLLDYPDSQYDNIKGGLKGEGGEE